METERIFTLKNKFDLGELRVEIHGELVRIIFDPYRLIVVERDEYIKWLRKQLENLTN